jgi:HlyD family secretion protein
MADPSVHVERPARDAGDPARLRATSEQGRERSPQEPAAPRSTEPKAAPSPSNSKARAALERDLGRVDRRKWLRWLGILLGIAVLGFGASRWYVRTRPPPPPKYVTAEITKGDVFETVQSTGQVKPLTEVQVGAQVSGRVTKVYVDFNSKVKAGDLLAEIDPTLFGAQIDTNRAQLAAATASVTRAESNLATAKQRVDRAKKVVAEGVGSQADLDTAQGAYDVAIADVAAAKAQVAQIGAVLRSSKTNLDYTRIFSPIDGIVINRAIDPGQTVAASFQAPTLFVIAQDLRKMRVLADIDEADVGRLAESMMAEVRVDAFPGESFKGVVSQVRYSPFNVSGVVTYAAVVEVDNPDIKLRPGMTATVTIRSAEAKDVSRVPNSTLRYKPSPPMDNQGKPIPQTPLPPLAPGKGRVYVLTDATLGAEKTELREVDIGITDGLYTVLKTDLGAVKVVTDETDDAGGKPKPRRMF